MASKSIIKNKQVVEEPFNWQLLDEEQGEALPDYVLVPIGRASSLGVSALPRGARATGLYLTGDDDPALAREFFEHIDTIAIAFPKFADGRGYSIARLLRQRYGWKGELRAVGQILHDQLNYLHRCGFDVLEIQEGKDPERALDAFKDFSVTYQPAADGEDPIYYEERPSPDKV